MATEDQDPLDGNRRKSQICPTSQQKEGDLAISCFQRAHEVKCLKEKTILHRVSNKHSNLLEREHEIINQGSEILFEPFVYSNAATNFRFRMGPSATRKML